MDEVSISETLCSERSTSRRDKKFEKEENTLLALLAFSSEQDDETRERNFHSDDILSFAITGWLKHSLHDVSLRHLYDQADMAQYTPEMQPQTTQKHHKTLQEQPVAVPQSCPLRKKHKHTSQPDQQTQQQMALQQQQLQTQQKHHQTLQQQPEAVPQSCPLRKKHKQTPQPDQQTQQQMALQQQQMQQYTMMQYPQHQQQQQQQQQYYYGQQGYPQMSGMYNSQPWYYMQNPSQGNYGYNYWYGQISQQMNTPKMFPLNPDLNGIVPASFYQSVATSAQSPEALAFPVSVQDGRPKAGGRMSAFNRNDSLTDVQTGKGLPHHGSDVDMARYRNVAERTLGTGSWDLSFPDPNAPLKKSHRKDKKQSKKDKNYGLEASIGSISNSFLNRIGLLMRLRKCKSKSKKQVYEESSDESFHIKKQGFLKRMFGDDHNHEEYLQQQKFSTPEMAINSVEDLEEFKDIENFRRLRQKQIDKQRKRFDGRQPFRMPGGIST